MDRIKDSLKYFMTEITQAPKVCPSCRVLTPINQMKKILSRSGGKTTNSWRCFACMERRQIALKAAKDRA
jgi:hypothetical protein